MKSEKLIYLPLPTAKQSEEKSVRGVFSRYLFHWPIFLVVLAITLCAAYFYNKTQKTVYGTIAKIAIKDERSAGASEKDEALAQLNMTSKPKLVESEIEIIRSRPLISKLVKDLDLGITYEATKNFKKVDLFGESPIEFKLLNPAKFFRSTQYKVKILSAQRYAFTTFDGKTQTAKFGTAINTSLGTWKLNLAKNASEWIGKDIDLTVQNPEDAISYYQANIGTIINKSAPIIDLTIKDEVPERSEMILNRLIEEYKIYNVNEKNKETESTLQFIDKRLGLLTGELTEAEKNVEGYKSSIGLTDISSKSAYYLENVGLNDKSMNEVNIQLNVIGEVEKYANSKDLGSVPATIGIADPGLVGLAGELSKLQLQKDKLLAITPAANPIFEALDEQIKSTRQALRQNIQGIKSSLLSTKNQLGKINNKFEGAIKSMPGQERQYVSIKRQQGTKESLYLYLLQKREEVAMSYASTLTDVHTVESAFSSPLPSKEPFVYTFAFLAGLILPAGFIFGREVLKNKILTKKEIEKATSVQVISEIVHEDGIVPIVIANSRNSSPIGEQFRALRTNLSQIEHDKERGRVILFTSSISGEGKSFVSSNIAVSLALSGRKTIVLELDLRKPKLTNIFKLNTEVPGVGDYLSGTASIDEAIQPIVQHVNLYAMRAGGPVDNPSELLESKQMVDLIDHLRNEYDNIIIDSPPLRLVTDAMILAPLSDMTMYLIRQGYTGKEELEFIKQLEDNNTLPNLKLIFNGLDNDRYGYGYNYDYSYYSSSSTAASKNVIKQFFKRF
jgi:tyrosine-protein kinase Etk/Wzc